MFDNLTRRLTGTLSYLKNRGRLTEENIKETLHEVRTALLEADVALPVVKQFTQRIQQEALGTQINATLTPGQTFIKIVQQELTAAMGGNHVELTLNRQPPAVILLIGAQGAGKTTTVVKLAHLLQKSKKKKVLVVSTDIYRPAAIQQLQVLAMDLGIDSFNCSPEDPVVSIARKAHQQAQLKFYDVLIVDTAGRLHIDRTLMEEAQQLHKLLNPCETLFVLDAMAGQDAANAAQVVDQQLPLTGIILTKADSDTRGGAALSAHYLTGKPIKYLGTGEKSDALEPFYPDRMASRILGMGDVFSLIEKIEHQSQNDAQSKKLARKLNQGANFDFADLRDQLQQMRRMGGVAELLQNLPGMHQLPGTLTSHLNNQKLLRMEAIINSMTLRERQVKDLIKGSRKRRIAAGAGVSVQEVNRLLKQFDEMQKMVKKVSKGGVAKTIFSLKSLLPGGFNHP